MICPNCGSANPDSARFCNTCGRALSGGCPVCGAANPPGARFCNQCGSPLAGGIPVEEWHTPSPDDSTYSSEHSEERRVVTVLFADLTSSTALADGMDAEDVRALLAGFFTIMARELHRHGGTVEKYIGDAVMAVFGLPIAHEDDPVRAVRAALDMQDALRLFKRDAVLAKVGLRLCVIPFEVHSLNSKTAA